MRLRTSRMRSNSGQSLIETLLTLPLLLILLFNAVNFGYLLLVALNLTAAPRTGVEYAIQGFETPSAESLPASGAPSAITSVSYETYQDMTGALNNPTGATVQVCSLANVNSSGAGTNGTGASMRTNCETCSGGTCTAPAAVTTGSSAPDPDPEAPSFILHRVAVTYTFTPLLNVPPFTIPLSWFPFCSGANGNCTITRFAEMRAMN
jgi:Flp pilus assembly protein TadG